MSTVTTVAEGARAERTPLYKSLFVQVLVALILGIVLGVAAPEFAVSLKILSDAFLKLISMIVAPIVFCVVVHGIAGAGDLKKVGRVGVKALVYFEVMTTVALVLGIILAFAFGPGHGMNIDPATLDEAGFERFMFTAGMPDPDLVIRTSGERRLSNFLMWQSAYSELVFLDVLWPDFGRADFESALAEFARRERRFGG